MRNTIRGFDTSSSSSASTSSSSSNETTQTSLIEREKRKLLEAISRTRKRGDKNSRKELSNAKVDISNAVRALEKLTLGKESCEFNIEGRWALVYSQNDKENAAILTLDDDNSAIVKDILDKLYEFFFSFLAPLAGGMRTSEKRRGEELFESIRNEQVVDVANNKVENFVDLNVLGVGKVRVIVRGEIKVLDKTNRKVQVTFTDWSLGDFLTLPLPRPTGGLENTFCDDKLRISRGSRGGLFITARIVEVE